jgi:hypothetical protein
MACLRSSYGLFTVRSRFVFGASSKAVLVLFVFAMDFVLVWTLVLWYTGRRFRVHWTLIFQVRGFRDASTAWRFHYPGHAALLLLDPDFSGSVRFGRVTVCL